MRRGTGEGMEWMEKGWARDGRGKNGGREGRETQNTGSGGEVEMNGDSSALDRNRCHRVPSYMYVYPDKSVYSD